MGYLVTFLKGLLSEAHNLKCFSYFFPSKPSIFTIKHLEHIINVAEKGNVQFNQREATTVKLFSIVPSGIFFFLNV